MTSNERIRELIDNERELGTRGEAYLDTAVLDALDELLKLSVLGPSISFPGEASEIFTKLCSQDFRGFGVTVTSEDGEQIEGVLASGSIDEDDDWAVCRIWAVEEPNDYETPEHYEQHGVAPRVVTAHNVNIH